MAEILRKSQNFRQYSEEHSIRHQRSTLCQIMDTDQPPLQTNYFSLNVENTGTYTKAVSTINIPLLSLTNDTRPSNKANVQATTYPHHSI